MSVSFLNLSSHLTFFVTQIFFSSSFFFCTFFQKTNHRTFCVDARASVVGLACDSFQLVLLLNNNNRVWFYLVHIKRRARRGSKRRVNERRERNPICLLNYLFREIRGHERPLVLLSSETSSSRRRRRRRSPGDEY